MATTEPSPAPCGGSTSGGDTPSLATAQELAVWLGDDQAEVVRLGLRDRLGQRPEVGLPGFVLLRSRLKRVLTKAAPLPSFSFSSSRATVVSPLSLAPRRVFI